MVLFLLLEVFFCADANGLITDFFSTNKLLETGFDIGLTFLPNPMLSNAKKSFKYAVKESKFLDDIGRVGITVKVTLATFAAVQNALYEEVKSKIKNVIFKNKITPYMNITKPIGGWT